MEIKGHTESAGLVCDRYPLLKAQVFFTLHYWPVAKIEYYFRILSISWFMIIAYESVSILYE